MTHSVALKFNVVLQIRLVKPRK